MPIRSTAPFGNDPQGALPTTQPRRAAFLQNSQQFGKQPFTMPKSLRLYFGNNCDPNLARHI
jgi:hypothetical protein